MKVSWKNPNVRLGVGFVVVFIAIGGLRLAFPSKKTGASSTAIDPSAIADQAYSQGKEQGHDEGYQAALDPSAIGDARKNAAISLTNAIDSGESVVDAMICARTGAYVDAANAKASEGVNPQQWLESQLREQTTAFKSLTVQYSTLNGTSTQQEQSVHAIVNYLAIAQAMAQLNGQQGARCQVDLTGAYTAGVSLLFEAQRAREQQAATMRAIDAQLVSGGDGNE